MFEETALVHRLILQISRSFNIGKLNLNNVIILFHNVVFISQLLSSLDHRVLWSDCFSISHISQDVLTPMQDLASLTCISLSGSSLVSGTTRQYNITPTRVIPP